MADMFFYSFQRTKDTAHWINKVFRLKVRKRGCPGQIMDKLREPETKILTDPDCIRGLIQYATPETHCQRSRHSHNGLLPVGASGSQTIVFIS